MRTTVTLPDDLMRQVRRKAAEADRPVKEVLAEAIRDGLHPSKRTRARRRFVVRPFRGGRVLPGVNLNSNSELLDLMDGL